MDALEGRASFRFVDGELDWTDSPDTSIPERLLEKPLKGWYHVLSDLTGDSPSQDELTNADAHFTYDNVYPALDRIRNILSSEGPFDIIIGFSQGSTLATMLMATEHCQPPPKCALLFSGMPPRDSRYVPKNKLTVPCVLVYGRRDPMETVCKTLSEYFDRPLTVTHSGGHELPKLDICQAIGTLLIKLVSNTANITRTPVSQRT